MKVTVTDTHTPQYTEWGETFGAPSEIVSTSPEAIFGDGASLAGTVTVTPVEGSQGDESQPAEKPDWMTQEEWNELPEFQRRAVIKVMKILCNDSFLNITACALLRTDRLTRANREVKFRMQDYPFGHGTRLQGHSTLVDHLEFGRRFWFATAEMVRRIRIEFPDVSRLDIVDAAVEMVSAIMLDELMDPEVGAFYLPSMRYAAQRASLASSSYAMPGQIAQSMWDDGRFFLPHIPTWRDVPVPPSGGGGDGGITPFSATQRNGVRRGRITGAP